MSVIIITGSSSRLRKNLALFNFVRIVIFGVTLFQHHDACFSCTVRSLIRGGSCFGMFFHLIWAKLATFNKRTVGIVPKK